MSKLERYSVYNQMAAAATPDHPLRDLLPDDREHGWHVSRNLDKPLNHIDFLRRKEDLAAEMGLHNIRTPPTRFDVNYGILEKHQAGLMTTDEVIRTLAVQSSAVDGDLLNASAMVRKKLREYVTIRHMEFHPSDVCNLSCCDCTYGHDDPHRKPPAVSFPFAGIPKIALLHPKSMVIIGEGEPTLYKNHIYRFQDMIEAVQAAVRGITLGLVTNGTHKPPGDWPKRMAWIRLSLDAATPATYCAFRGKPLFDSVLRNFLAYLDHDVRWVGLSFLFAQKNIHEYAQAAKLVYEIVKREKPHALHKVSVSYRPLRHDPYQYARPFDDAVTDAQIQQTILEIRDLADSSPGMKAFLRNQTNISAILGGNSHPPHEFSRCHYSQTFKIVRANGDLRPCFIRVSEPDFKLGNLLTDSMEAIALNTLYVGARRKPHCDPHGCRQCHVNYTFEQGLKGKLKVSDSAEVRSDPMY